MNKYQEALNKITKTADKNETLQSDLECFYKLQELVNKETPIKPKLINCYGNCNSSRKDKQMTDKVNKPHHYVGSNGMEVEQFLKEFMTKEGDGYIAHRKASAIEYIIRAFHKEDGIEDINKAIKNLELIKDHRVGKIKVVIAESGTVQNKVDGEWGWSSSVKSIFVNGVELTDHLEKFKNRYVGDEEVDDLIELLEKGISD